MFLSGCTGTGSFDGAATIIGRMPWVRRATDGSIASLHRGAEADAGEFLPDHHPDVRSFVGGDDFGRLDADFVRVIEDVIDTLIIKNVLNITDLPEQAQAKLLARKSFRERITRHSLRLFGDVGDGAANAVIGDTHFDTLR